VFAARRNSERMLLQYFSSKKLMLTDVLVKETKRSETKGKHNLQEVHFKLHPRGMFIQLIKYLSRYLPKKFCYNDKNCI